MPNENNELKNRRKITNPALFYVLCFSAFLILALASYTLSTPPGQRPGSEQEK
jgi:hypothetical protein